MIRSLSADKPSFKTINFQPGLNVILAERIKESSKKDSRNGLGKSTLIEILHFCLGAGKRAETLKKTQLDDWTFTLKLDLNGKTYSISRNTNDINKIFVEGDCSDWPIKPEIDEDTRNQVVTRNEWTKILGSLMFGLELTYEYKYAPTFRSLISYCIRKNGQTGGFLNPFQQYKAQLEWDIQVNNTLLLGLGWEHASQWQVLKDRMKVIEQIKQEAASGIISNLMGDIGELESEKIRLESQVKQETDNLENFRVHEQYHHLEKESNKITKQIPSKPPSSLASVNFWITYLSKSNFCSKSLRGTVSEFIVQMY